MTRNQRKRSLRLHRSKMKWLYWFGYDTTHHRWNLYDNDVCERRWK